MRIMAYYVFNGRAWLQDDEKSWGDFFSAQAFNDCDLAQDIGEREAKGEDAIYTFGLLT